MKGEHPILFSAPMVRAILDGRKRQTRRLIRPDWWRCLDPEDAADRAQALAMCPHGVPGDRLWVKEAWRPRVVHSHADDSCDCGDLEITYAADGSSRLFSDQFFSDNELNSWLIPKSARNSGNASPLFMPRWASRLTLEVTGVRVERLQDISEADAKAEGFPLPPAPGWINGIRATVAVFDARLAFQLTWDSLNAKRASWASSPWVWVISFERVEPKEKEVAHA